MQFLGARRREKGLIAKKKGKKKGKDWETLV